MWTQRCCYRFFSIRPEKRISKRHRMEHFPLFLRQASPPRCASLGVKPLRAPSQRLSRHERMDTDAPLPRRIAGHAAGGGAGHEGKAWCARGLSRTSKRKGMGGTRARLLEIAILRGAGREKSLLLLLLNLISQPPRHLCISGTSSPASHARSWHGDGTPHPYQARCCSA